MKATAAAASAGGEKKTIGMPFFAGWWRSGRRRERVKAGESRFDDECSSPETSCWCGLELLLVQCPEMVKRCRASSSWWHTWPLLASALFGHSNFISSSQLSHQTLVSLHHLRDQAFFLLFLSCHSPTDPPPKWASDERRATLGCMHVPEL